VKPRKPGAGPRPRRKLAACGPPLPSLREPHPHPYLLKKGVAPVPELREICASKVPEIAGYAPKYRGDQLIARLLVARIKVGDEFANLELIDEAGRKSVLSGGPKKDGFWAAQELPDGDGAEFKLLVGEGIGTVLSAKQATGYLAVAALSSSNLRAVAKAMRERYPKAVLGILAELGNGQKAAEEAARATGSALALPDFGPNPPEGLSDFNDMLVHRGRKAVAECIAAQMAAQEDARQSGAEDERSDTKTEPGLTDLGNAHRFAREHREDIRYCWPWGKWLVWNSRFWSRDETGEIHRLAEATVRAMYTEAATTSSPQEERRKALGGWATKCESHEQRAKMLASAQAIAGIPVRPEDLDRDPWLLNVRNGTIDLRTGALRPHAREDLITRGIDVDYDPAAVCPTWDRFISEVFGGAGETIAFVQRAIGYSLTGDVREHAFFIAQGAGSNGKSTLLGALHSLLGAYAGRVPTELLMARPGEHHPTERATLYSKRFVYASETGDGRRLAEDLVKSLIGGDPIQCRRMRWGNPCGRIGKRPSGRFRAPSRRRLDEQSRSLRAEHGR
jgi:D5-like protein/Toprim domain-containing protein